MKIKYECRSWQGLIQQAVYLVSRGYYYHHVNYIPEEKMDKVTKIDQKIIQKYQCDKSKFQRARLKNKKIANFYYLRYKNIFLIMHTDGRIQDISYDDKFMDIRKKKSQIRIRISELVTIEIFLSDYKKGGERTVTVKLDKKTYQGFKDVFIETAGTKDITLMKKEFDKINGFPAWSGIIKQKVELAKFLAKQAQRHQIGLKVEDLRIISYRKPVKVFKEDLSE